MLFKNKPRLELPHGPSQPIIPLLQTLGEPWPIVGVEDEAVPLVEQLVAVVDLLDLLHLGLYVLL